MTDKVMAIPAPDDDQETSLTASRSAELAPTTQAARATAEIQGALTVAQRMPRNEDACLQRLMRACGRPGFAQKAEYSFPRGGSKIVGPSIYFAREAGRCWGNIRFGFNVTRDDEDNRQVTGWAWDLETNTYVEQSIEFAKKLQRKRRIGGKEVTEWVTPDERDLRELTNRQGAIAQRNAILQIIPEDIKDECLREARETLVKGITEDPDGTRKKIIAGFGKLNVPVERLEEYLGGTKLSEASPHQLGELRSLWQGITDGDITIAKAFAAVKASRGLDHDPGKSAADRRAEIMAELEALDGVESPAPEAGGKGSVPAVAPVVQVPQPLLPGDSPDPSAPTTQDREAGAASDAVGGDEGDAPATPKVNRLHAAREALQARCEKHGILVGKIQDEMIRQHGVGSVMSLTADHYELAVEQFSRYVDAISSE